MPRIDRTFNRSGHWHKASELVTPSVTIVSGPTVSTFTENSAEIAWTLSRGATGQVEYGATAGYGSTTTEETSFGFTTHVQTITGLTAGTTYHFRVVGEDADANAYASADDTFTTETAAGAAGTYPTTVVTQQTIALVSYARPAYQVSTADATFGTEVVRVSNDANSGHQYPSKPVWNADGSLLILTRPSGKMLRASDFTVLQSSVSTGNANSWTWSADDPTRAWAYDGAGAVAREYTVNTTTGAYSYTTFTISGPGGSYVSIDWAGGQGATSLDDKFAFMWTRSSTSGIAVIDLPTKSVIWEKALSGSLDNCGISWSGRYVLWCGSTDGTGTAQGMRVWDIVSDADSGQPQQQEEHWDFTQDAGGTDWLCYRGSSSYNPYQGVWAYRCSDRTKRQLIPSGGGTGPGTLHISGRNYQRRGYIYYSEYSGSYSGTMLGQVAAISIDDPADVEVFSQTHRGGTTYLDEPHACPNPDGTQVIWRANWEGTGSVYAFVAGVDVGV